MSVAMCDSLACPVGFQPRQQAYKIGCVSQVCSLDMDGPTCCVRRVEWWMLIMSFVAMFCCLSLLCGTLGGISQRHLDKMRSGKQRRTKVRHNRTRADESEEREEEELLEREASFEAEEKSIT